MFWKRVRRWSRGYSGMLRESHNSKVLILYITNRYLCDPLLKFMICQLCRGAIATCSTHQLLQASHLIFTQSLAFRFELSSYWSHSFLNIITISIICAPPLAAYATDCRPDMCPNHTHARLTAGLFVLDPARKMLHQPGYWHICFSPYATFATGSSLWLSWCASPDWLLAAHWADLPLCNNCCPAPM